MIRLIAFILIIISFASCTEKKAKIEPIESDNLTQKQIDSILTDFKFQYESPITLEGANQILIPISTQLLEKRKVFSKDGYSTDDYPRFWNVLFYNLKTGETRLLTEKKLRISEIHVKNDQYERTNKIINGKILYRIGEIDFNKDNSLNDLDPEYLFASDTNGTNLLRISPQNESLEYFEVIPNSNQILLRTLRDTNSDSAFRSDDEAIWYKVELTNNEWKIQEVISPSKRKSIENLYFEQWLKKKPSNTLAE